MWGAEIAAVVSIEFAEVGLNTISKASMIRGMNNFVFNVYSTAIGLLFLLPLTFFFHRVRAPPKLTFSMLCRICLLGTMGYIATMLMFFGIGYSSPTMASAMNNLIPASTFILARITRMEKLELKSRNSQAKCIGTIISILGAFTVTFYEGPSIFFAPKASSGISLHHQILQSPQQDWVLGGFLLAAGSFTLALLFIVQTWIIKDYPSEVIVTLIGNGFSIIFSPIVALFLVRDPNDWKLRPDMELITILYAAIFTVSLRNAVGMWVVRRKGPVFVTMFKPLAMVIALIMGIAFLGDTLYLGSVIGAVIIALGSYLVLWGKVEEEKAIEDSYSDKLPLLKKKPMET